MSFVRSSRALAALVLLGVCACSKPEPAQTKPAPTPEVSIPGIDTSKLMPRERREWAQQVSELLAPCPEIPVSIAVCAMEKRPCKACVPAAGFLLKQVQAGRAKKEREDAFHARFDTGTEKTIATDGSPELGSPDAIVTVVEWADFECPACRGAYPFLDDVVRRYPSQVRLVFKFYPLQAHAHGENTARAAAAAYRQGKFWEMHHILFENQEKLEPADLERYAKQLGLNVVKFRADMASKEVTERIQKDRKQAEDLGLDGTPFIFSNGRYINLQHLVGLDDVAEWVKLDIELAGQAPKPAPSSSAAPSAAPGSSSTAPSSSSGAAPSSAPKAAGAGATKPSAKP